MTRKPKAPEQLTPEQALEKIVADRLAADPHFYDDPDAPKTPQYASGSNSRLGATSYLTPDEQREAYWQATGFHPSGSYGPDDSPIPVETAETLETLSRVFDVGYQLLRQQGKVR
jgi:hypothetical protein